MRRILFLAIFALGLTGASAETIKITADVWPPYTMDPAGGSAGYLIDVAKAVFDAQGHSVVYSVKPYARAINDTKSGVEDGVAGIYTNDAAELKLHYPANELGVSINTFFVRAEDSWSYEPTKGNANFSTLRIGVITDYSFKEIQDYLDANKTTQKVQYISGDQPLEANLRKLLAKRIDATIDDKIVVNYLSKQLGLSDKIKAAGSLSDKNSIVIAFSAANPNGALYARQLSEGVAKLRANGSLKKILARYALSDWK
jgi:polar amino acid transport system substrate-binding protein